MTSALADHGIEGCQRALAVEWYLARNSATWAFEVLQDDAFGFTQLFLLDQQTLTASARQVDSVAACLPRPARKLRLSDPQRRLINSHGQSPNLQQQQQQQHVAAPAGQQEQGDAGQQQQRQPAQQCAVLCSADAAAAEAAEGLSCKPAATQGQPATECSNTSSSSSELLQELHRLRLTKFCQAAGPLMLSIFACLLVLALLPQLQQTLAGASSSNGSSRCSNGKCQLLVQALPGLAAVAVSQLRPLQFRAPHLERGFQGCATGSKRAIDILFSSVWCVLALCTSLRVSWQAATAAAAGAAVEQAGGVVSRAVQRVLCWCLASFSQLPTNSEACAASWTLRVPPSVLLLVLPMASLLLTAWKAPNSSYLTLREPLHVLCRLVMITGLGVAGQQASTGLLLLTLLHALTVACSVVRFSTFIPIQLMQTVALLLCTHGATLLSGVQLISAGLLVPCFVVLQVEAAARQAYLAAGLPCADLTAGLPVAKHRCFGGWHSSSQPAAVGGISACRKGDEVQGSSNCCSVN